MFVFTGRFSDFMFNPKCELCLCRTPWETLGITKSPALQVGWILEVFTSLVYFTPLAGSHMKLSAGHFSAVVSSGCGFNSLGGHCKSLTLGLFAARHLTWAETWDQRHMWVAADGGETALPVVKRTVENASLAQFSFFFKQEAFLNSLNTKMILKFYISSVDFSCIVGLYVYMSRLRVQHGRFSAI